jgi:hypothetical protein
MFPLGMECHHPNISELHHYSEGKVETTNQPCLVVEFLAFLLVRLTHPMVFHGYSKSSIV